jgi:hypothetical protein
VGLVLRRFLAFFGPFFETRSVALDLPPRWEKASANSDQNRQKVDRRTTENGQKIDRKRTEERPKNPPKIDQKTRKV